MVIRKDFLADTAFLLLIDSALPHALPGKKRLAQMLKAARFKLAATMQDVDYEQPRDITKLKMAKLVNCDWRRRKQNLLLTWPRGTSKSWLSCSFGHSDCRMVTVFATSDLLVAGDHENIKRRWKLYETDQATGQEAVRNRLPSPLRALLSDNLLADNVRV